MSDERKLTEEDREKISRLLVSGTQENINLGLSLMEQTAGPEDLADIFTMNVIVEIICLAGPESLNAMVRAGHFILMCPTTWERFKDAVADANVLTFQRYQELCSIIEFVNNRYPSKYLGVDDLKLSRFTAISIGAADQLVEDSRQRVNLEGLTFLSDAVAKILSEFDGELRLDGLKELTDTAAESLGQHAGKLSLKGLVGLSDSSTGSLSKHGELKTNAKIRTQIKKYISSTNRSARKSSQTGQRVLTKGQTTKIRKLLRGKSSDQAEMAVQLIETSGATPDDVSDVFSSTIISLLVNTWDVDVWNALAPLLTANQLLKQEFVDLVCRRILKNTAPSMTTFSESLFSRAGAPLCQLLTHPASLQELGKVWDNWPRPNITELSEAGAELLMLSGKGHDPYLGSLSSLSGAVAKSLSKHEGLLDLDGLTELSDAAAESLSQYEGRLDLNGLKELSDTAAESLGKHKGYLNLNGLTSLSGAAAESLSKHKGDLNLNGLTTFSDAAAESLSNFEGYRLHLNGLTELSDAAAESLSEMDNSNLYVNLDNLPASAAQILGSLELSPEKAYEFLTGTLLFISQFTEINDEAATILSRCDKPKLIMNSITSLTDQSAQALSEYEGDLRLLSVKELSDTAAGHLAKHPNLTINLDNLPASAAQILRDAGHGE